MPTPELVSFGCEAIFVFPGNEARDLEARKTTTRTTVHRNSGNKTLTRRAGATAEQR